MSGVNLIIQDGSAADIMNSTCNAAGVSTSISGPSANNVLRGNSLDDTLDLEIGTVVTATRLSVCWTYTYE